MSKIIQLTDKASVIVDDEDFEYLNHWKWQLASGAATRSKYPTGCYIMHRVIMKCPADKEVDHINNNPLDNRKENLRICTHAENMANSSIQKNNTSGYKGVYWNANRKKWQAQISVKNKVVSLGRFENIEEAARAYDKAAKENYGIFAKLNNV
mgnify:CR=1 FL=1